MDYFVMAAPRLRQAEMVVHIAQMARIFRPADEASIAAEQTRLPDAVNRVAGTGGRVARRKARPPGNRART